MALPMASESSELPPSRAALAGPPSFIDGAPPSLAPLPEPLAPADKPAGWYAKFKQAVKALKREVLALHYAIQARCVYGCSDVVSRVTSRELGSPRCSTSGGLRLSVIARAQLMHTHSPLPQDPRVGWLPRLVALMALAYALSPLDLIPDFIPVLGLIDDVSLLSVML